MIEEIELQAAITEQKELDAIENKFPAQPPRRIIRHSARVTIGGKLKALFLKPEDNLAPIPERYYKPALKVLDADWKMFPWRPSMYNSRPMVRQMRVRVPPRLGAVWHVCGPDQRHSRVPSSSGRSGESVPATQS